MDILYIASGLALLILGGDSLLRSAVAFSLRLKIPKIVIGMTIVSLATSTPELIVSLKAAIQGHCDFAVGNVVGSNIANIGFVLGITVLLSKIDIRKSFYTIDLPMLWLSSFLLYFLLSFDKNLHRYEGIFFVVILILFLYFLACNHHRRKESTEMDIVVDHMALYKIWIYLIVGCVCLWVGSKFLIFGAINLAKIFGVSERIIGVSVVSLGTSIPELAASVIAIIKKEKSISIGNLIGSNIFNILAVLGITASINPIFIKDKNLIGQDIYWMLGLAVLLPILSKLFKKDQLGKLEGFVLLIFYAGFIYFCVL